MCEDLTIRRSVQLAGREVGALAYGCWRFGDAGAATISANLHAALEVGIEVIDIAAIYGFGPEGLGRAERQLGAVLAAEPGLRARLVLVSKAGIEPPTPYDSRRDVLVQSAEASLTRLGIAQLDLFLVHRPDVLVHPEEVAAALDHLVRSGKVAAVGVSNYSVAQTRALQRYLDVPLVATQPEISPLALGAFADGTLDLAQECAMRSMAWSPLGGGALMVGDSPVGQVLDRIGAGDRAAAALAWLLAHPAGIMPIIGSQKPTRIRAAAAAFDIKMTRRDWYAVLEASLGHAMP